MSNLWGQRSTNNDSSIPITASNIGDKNSLDVSISDNFTTDFDELLTAKRDTIFNIKPTWGLSEFRDDTANTSGTGAQVDEFEGEFRLQTGTSTNNVVELQTTSRGIYRPGLMGQAGFGFRLPTDPTGTQDFKWGYFDDANGFGFGVNSSGLYIFRRYNSTDNEVTQSNWNVDKLDGSGPSGLNIDLSKGHIFQVDFTWYGYGTIQFSILIEDGISKRRVPIHRMTVDEQVSVIDPNQPITIRGTNGASTSTNLTAYVGGRQFSILGGDATVPSRGGAEINSSYQLTAGEGVWEPILLLRKKATHGPSSRSNSVNIAVNGFDAYSDDSTAFKLTVGGSSSGSPWTTPSEMTDIESAAETIIPAGGMTISGSPIATNIGYVSDTNGNASGNIDVQDRIQLGKEVEAILWAKQLTANSTTVTGILSWEEQW